MALRFGIGCLEIEFPLYEVKRETPLSIHRNENHQFGLPLKTDHSKRRPEFLMKLFDLQKKHGTTPRSRPFDRFFTSGLLHWVTKSFQVPKMEVLYLIRLF